jgi:hypothetical protein
MTDPAKPQLAAKGLKSDQISGVLLTALAVYVWWLNREFPVGTLADPGPGYVPLLLAIGLGAIGLMIAAFGGRSELLSAIPWPEAKRAAIILLACTMAGLALEYIGYRLTIFGFLVFFIGVIERKPALAVALVSAGFSLLSFYVIGDLLHVPLPVGPWGF